MFNFLQSRFGKLALYREEWMDSHKQEIASTKEQARKNAEDRADFVSQKKIANIEHSANVATFENQKLIDKVQTDKELAARTAMLDAKERAIELRESTLQQEKELINTAHIHAVSMARLEEQKSAGDELLSIKRELETHKANTEAKDLIISHLKTEVEHWKEMTQVLAGKLTQVDLKGITIHVEAANPGDKKQENKN